jgi:DNA modification methylase
MIITAKPIDSLIPYANNARKHDENQIKQIASSIKEFGFNNPVLIDKDNGIIAGHGRVLAAQRLGWTEVPTIALEHLTETQKKAFILADNRIAMNSTWDNELLAIELEALNGEMDLTDLGFEPGEINKLLNGDVIDGLTDVDDTPATPAEPKAMYGDIYQLGEHRLMCGDSTKEEDVQKLLYPYSDETMHCISDPPYGIAYDPKADKYGMIKNDDVFLDYIGLAKKYTNGFFYMWTGYQVVDEWMKRIKQEFERVTNIIIWHKGGGGMGDCMRTLSSDFEIGLVVHRDNLIQSGRIGSVWDFQEEEKAEWIAKASKDELKQLVNRMTEGPVVWKVGKDNTAFYMHPTQKPVEVNQKALKHFTKLGDVVVDLFLGSGSNLIACETLQRKCAGMELDPKYVDVIIQRWEEFTGKKAEKIDGVNI